MGLGMARMGTLASAEGTGAIALSDAGLASLAELRAKPAQEVFTAIRGGNLVVDGYLIPEALSQTFANGRQNPVDLLIGSKLVIVATASLLTSREAQSQDFWTTKRTTYGYATGQWRVYCANNWDATAYLFAYLGSIKCERLETSDYPYESATQSAAVQAFAASIEASNTIICPLALDDPHRLDFEVAVADAATFTALQRSLGYHVR